MPLTVDPMFSMTICLTVGLSLTFFAVTDVSVRSSNDERLSVIIFKDVNKPVVICKFYSVVDATSNS